MIAQVKQLSKQYGKITAVNNMSFSVNKGEVLGIVGPNGSGKTTLFSMLLGLVKPSSGDVQILGSSDVDGMRRKIGATLDLSFFYLYLSAWEHLKIVAKLKNVPKSQIEDKLKLVGLWGRHHDAVKKYSMGMKQRLSVAIALLNNPELVILDEPTNGLDPKGIIDMRNIIHNIAEEGRTVLVSSHILSEIEKTCTRILMIEKGNLVQELHINGGDNEQNVANYEIASSNVSRLQELLKQSKLVAEVHRKNNQYLIQLKATEVEQLMRYLAQHDVYINHFVKQNTNLESLFLKED